jgi:hypothetical protein
MSLTQLRGLGPTEPTREWPAWEDYPGETWTVQGCLRLESLGYCYDAVPLDGGGWRVFYWR